MDIHHKKFLGTLIGLLLVVAGVILLIIKHSSALSSDEQFSDALMRGAIESEKYCLIGALGETRQQEISAHPESMTEEELATLNLCANS